MAELTASIASGSSFSIVGSASNLSGEFADGSMKARQFVVSLLGGGLGSPEPLTL
jgi:hypothetical protein